VENILRISPLKSDIGKVVKTLLNKDILKTVERPSRYIGEEWNSIKKDRNKVKVLVALIFPDVYEVGISHLGLRILYHIINSLDFALAERAYSPWIDMESQMEKYDIPLFTVESKSPVSSFDLIGFSLQSELLYTNMVNCLRLSGIEPYTSDRKDTFPLVIAGGPTTANPEPIADFMDAIVIGDGEEVIVDMIKVIKEAKENELSKDYILKKWAEIQGVYIPSFYHVEYLETDRIKAVIPRYSFCPSKVKKAVVRDLNEQPFPIKQIVPYAPAVHDRAVVEVFRGCNRGCRFCQAGTFYRPVRERNKDSLVEMIKDILKSTGYEEVGLLSLNTSDYTSLSDLTKEILPYLRKKHISVSIPSSRIDSFDFNVNESIDSGRRTALTLAPEAGTQRLRNIINKGITEEEIKIALRKAYEMGWQRIKLYFMIGLPYEEEKDIDGILSLLDWASSLGFRKINVSISNFIPKAWTPFQFVRQKVEEIYGIQKRLKAFSRTNRRLHISLSSPQRSLIEGILSRGDRRLSRVIYTMVYKKNERFDDCPDLFSFSRWQEAMNENGLSFTMYTRERDVNEILPWDHISLGIDKEYIKREYNISKTGILTPDCRWNQCCDCGVCMDLNVRNVLCKIGEQHEDRH